MKSKIGEGSLFQRKDGFWSASVCLGNGERKQIVRKTKEQAQSAMAYWLMQNGYIELELSGDYPAANIVKEFIENYLAGLRVRRTRNRNKSEKAISSRTLENYVYMLRPFETRFADIPLRAISSEQLNGWLRELENKRTSTGQYKYSQVTLDRIVYITNTMFRRACRKNWIETNPFDSEDFKYPISHKETPEVVGFTDEELSVIIPALRGNLKLFAPFTMLIETGMRSEELLALTWQDYDPNTGAVTINKAKTYQTFLENGRVVGHKHEIAETKQGAGDRVVWLSKSGQSVMEEWRQWAPRHTCTKVGPRDFMFGNSRNPSWTHSGLYSALTNQIKNLPNAPDTFRLHRIRHLVGTMLAEGGANEYAVMQQLGHQKAETTQRYIDQSRRINANNSKILERSRQERNLG
ncbi:tyrosine-type recombinase/integrase [Allofournierella sp. CML151]|uniref:tyrosine-type recombinase/integrase n=1 Tax=Allofournierella sp. CML151 TaxID=2998082 RepID=UPI0022EB9825|nr:site-specific integrase [Fournierella sp. CML151]